MIEILPLLFLVTTPDAPMDAGHPEAVEVFQCDFGESTDVNHDGWPDHWERRRGPGYPTYLEIGIRERSSVGDRCLRVELNGGAAALFSPPIAVNPMFSYVLEASVKTAGLKHNAAYLSVTFYDAQRKPLAISRKSKRLSGNSDSTRLRVGPISPDSDRAALAVVGLHLTPQDSGFDLRGAAEFESVSLSRLPRMTLRTNSPHNVYTDPEEIEATCGLSGIQERDPLITFELLDRSHNALATKDIRLDGEAATRNQLRPSRRGEKEDVPDTEAAGTGYVGEVSWKPPITNYGFYRVRARMVGTSGVLHERVVTLAVVRPQPTPSGGEFGWSLPHGDDVLSLNELSSLLALSGVNWVKFPVWYDEAEDARAEALAHFAERLSTRRIELVGLLDQPPPESRKMFSDNDEHLPAASVFDDPRVWYPALNPVITRLALKVRWWQLGRDVDNSFVRHPHLYAKVGEIKGQIGRFGQEIHLGIGWGWLDKLPAEKQPPWDFLTLTANPALTAEELATYLKASDSVRQQRWLLLQPLPKRHYDTAQRASDLVSRMLAAKMNGTDIAFASDPFDEETGLMNADGTPGELLLPWRTTASMISGTDFLGSIVLPGGSRNYILTRGEEAIMVVWNEKPTEEVINLGDPKAIEHVDLWGRITRPQQREHRQVYQVGPLPTFVTGISREMALWRMNFHFVQRQLDVVYGRPQYPQYRMKNPFRQGAGGTMTINTPEIWGKPPAPIRVKLAGGEERTEAFAFVLRSNASTGKQPVRVDFDLTVDGNNKFSVWREMEVGLGHVVIELSTYLDEDGLLVVQQDFTNKTDQPVNFKCFLFAPGRKRLRHNVLDLSRGTSRKFYKLRDGAELEDKQLWLRAEEIYGDRVLNYRFNVEL